MFLDDEPENRCSSCQESSSEAVPTVDTQEKDFHDVNQALLDNILKELEKAEEIGEDSLDIPDNIDYDVCTCYQQQ